MTHPDPDSTPSPITEEQREGYEPATADDGPTEEAEGEDEEDLEEDENE